MYVEFWRISLEFPIYLVTFYRTTADILGLCVYMGLFFFYRTATYGEMFALHLDVKYIPLPTVNPFERKKSPLCLHTIDEQ